MTSSLFSPRSSTGEAPILPDSNEEGPDPVPYPTALGGGIRTGVGPAYFVFKITPALREPSLSYLWRAVLAGFGILAA